MNFVFGGDEENGGYNSYIGTTTSSSYSTSIQQQQCNGVGRNTKKSIIVKHNNDPVIRNLPLTPLPSNHYKVGNSGSHNNNKKEYSEYEISIPAETTNSIAKAHLRQLSTTKTTTPITNDHFTNRIRRKSLDSSSPCSSFVSEIVPYSMDNINVNARKNNESKLRTVEDVVGGGGGVRETTTTNQYSSSIKSTSLFHQHHNPLSGFAVASSIVATATTSATKQQQQSVVSSYRYPNEIYSRPSTYRSFTPEKDGSSMIQNKKQISQRNIYDDNESIDFPKAPTPGDYDDIISNEDSDIIDDKDTVISGYYMPGNLGRNNNSKLQQIRSSSIRSSSYSTTAFHFIKNAITSPSDSSVEDSVGVSVASSCANFSTVDDMSSSSYDGANHTKLSNVNNATASSSNNWVSYHVDDDSSPSLVEDGAASLVSSRSSALVGESILIGINDDVVDLQLVPSSIKRNENRNEMVVSSSRMKNNKNQHRQSDSTWKQIVDPENLRDLICSFRGQLNTVHSTCQKGSDALSTRWKQQSRIDLKSLTAHHQQKVHQLSSSCVPASFGVGDAEDPDDMFDFVIVLKPQEVYSYWSELLDFRIEMLGQYNVDLMEEQWESGGLLADDNHTEENSNDLRYTTTDVSSQCAPSSSSSKTSSPSSDDEHNQRESWVLNEPTSASPPFGVRRRRIYTADQSSMAYDDLCRLSTTPVAFGKPQRSPNRGISRISPSLQSAITSLSAAVAGGIMSNNKKERQQSMFERAIGTPDAVYSIGGECHHMSIDTIGLKSNANPSNLWPGQSSYNTPIGIRTTNFNHSNTVPTNINNRRRWGNNQQQIRNGDILSSSLHDVDSYTVGGLSTADRVQHQQNRQESLEIMSGVNKNDNESIISPRCSNEIRMQDIQNKLIAPGVAARTIRTNGMLPFLNALKEGIVIRRHRPNCEAVFCRILSNDNGDSIHYVPVDYETAMSAFSEQRIRFNKFDDTNKCEVQPWSMDDTNEEVNNHEKRNSPHSKNNCLEQSNFSEELNRKKKNAEKTGIANLAAKVVSTGFVKVADIVAVHPARNKDPRSDSGEFGSISLRKSKAEFDTNLSFSLVLRNATTRVARGNKENIDDLETKWLERQGNEAQFKYLDFEAATEGEYWLVLRGFLFLHRDAAVGRFSKQRAAGFGSLAERSTDESHYKLHEDEFQEPKTIGCIEKLVMNIRGVDPPYLNGIVREGARPPPSDYFLGFRSPGTAIWSRLRQAGLETRRVYSLDPKKVMLKIRCPADRLSDVAEVLRVKIKTKEGTFAPFHEELIDIYDSPFNSMDGLFRVTNSFQFRSSVRQSIINFIIGSRIRDSGAELGQTSELGKLVESRVPLHMHRKLDAIFNAWFFFWRVENWEGRDGRSLSHTKVDVIQSLDDDDSICFGTDDKKKFHTAAAAEKLANTAKIPWLLTRFFCGCFYQPLDSIEEYFGEKVAFYFAWLQHAASHLVFLSMAGLVVFICQLASNDVNHRIRPYFSVVVMLWTFMVLINWKKRANFMAHRWGTLNYKEQETTRSQFHGTSMRDIVTGEEVISYSKWKRWLKYTISFPITLLFTAGTLLLILWVHSNRDLQLAAYVQSKQSSSTTDLSFDFTLSSIGRKKEMVELDLTSETLCDPTFWFLVVALPSMLGLFLPLLNFILMRLSMVLNDFENYKTESEYRTFLIIKVFSFRFVCYFATLYYYAFMSVGDEEAILSGILRVSSGVLVYTTVAQYWQNFLHVCFPILIRKIRMRHRRQRLCTELNQIELEEDKLSKFTLEQRTGGDNNMKRQQQIRLVNKRLLLEQAQDDVWLELMNPQHDSFPEYIQAIVQFTFVACFSVVLPITPLIVLINHLISMRLDAFKLCKGRRRPLSEKTGGIGVWEHLLNIVAVISVLTNCWLMGFTSAQAIRISENVGELGVFAFIVCWEHIMLLIKYILSTAISTLPKSLRDAMKKEQHVLDQQRNAIMRLRRQQRDHSENSTGVETSSTNHPTTLTELNKRALYNGSIFPQSSTIEEEQENHASTK